MSSHRNTPDTSRKARILIVDDEPMIALTLEELLIDAGFAIAGVAGRLEAALEIIEGDETDAAILDANLAGVSSGPAAIALKARNIPFVVVSGYSREQQSAAFAGAIHLQKPCKPDRLIQVLHDILPDR